MSATHTSTMPQHGHGITHAHDAHDHHEPGFWQKYIFSTDHKVIGIQYILTGLVMALVGASLAALIRLQLGWPEHQWIWLSHLLPKGMPGGVMTPEFYLAVVTMHGTIMVFFFISYVLVSGFGNYLVFEGFKHLLEVETNDRVVVGD